MELYLFRPSTFRRHYNCSFYSVDDVPLEQRTHPKLGAALIFFSLLFEALYLPCLAVIYRHLRQSSCYKFMLYIGVVDLLTLPFNGFLTGLLAVEGAVYCSHPTLIFHVGIYLHGEGSTYVCAVTWPVWALS